METARPMRRKAPKTGVLLSTLRSYPMREGGGYYASIKRIYHAHTADDITNAGPPQMTYCR